MAALGHAGRVLALASLLLVAWTPVVSTSSAQESLEASSLLANLLEEARREDLRGFMLECRHHLHQIPELQFDVHDTSAYVRSKLDEMGIPYKHPFATAGISAVIGGSSPGPAIALRTDMDALPIQEPEDLPGPRSGVAGRMHACGHDAHMSMLLGAAKLLKAHEAKLPGKVVLLFQPAEEGGGGARYMIEEGALQGAQAVAGMHVWPSLPSGTVATRVGTIMAASDRFSFVVDGRGGHGALPHLAADPVVAAAATVMALQTLVSRETSPVDGAVVTVSRFNTGPGASNVIPDSVKVQGTIRALTQQTFDRLHQRLEQVAKSTAGTYGCVVNKVDWSPVPYPPTVNHPDMVELVAELAAAAAASPGNNVTFERLAEPSMAAEDFSFYGSKVPSIMTFVGIGDSARGTDVPLHNPRFRMDDEQMPLGAALHAATALRYLIKHSTEHTGHDEL